MKLPTKKAQPLGTEPLYNEECNMWYFDQLFFYISGKKLEILSTQIIDKSKDVIHSLRTESNKIIELKMSFIVEQFKLAKSKTIKEPIQVKTIINNQNKLNI